MSWPKGRPRPRKVGSEQEGMAAAEMAEMVEVPAGALAAMHEQNGRQVPIDWRKGALLNVRNYGAEYVITLWPEEQDEQKPERCIKFTNLGECQDFVSNWYAREHSDPRAR